MNLISKPSKKEDVSQRRKGAKTQRKIGVVNQIFNFAISAPLREIFMISVLFRQPQGNIP